MVYVNLMLGAQGLRGTMHVGRYDRSCAVDPVHEDCAGRGRWEFTVHAYALQRSRISLALR